MWKTFVNFWHANQIKSDILMWLNNCVCHITGEWQSLMHYWRHLAHVKWLACRTTESIEWVHDTGVIIYSKCCQMDLTSQLKLWTTWRVNVNLLVDIISICCVNITLFLILIWMSDICVVFVCHLHICERTNSSFSHFLFEDNLASELASRSCDWMHPFLAPDVLFAGGTR